MTLNSALMHHQINSTEYLKAFHAPSFEKVVVELLLIIRIFRLTLRFAVFKVNRYDNSDPCKTYIPTCKSYFPTQKRDPEGLLCAISGSPGQNVTVRHPGFLFPYSGLSSSKHPRAFSRPPASGCRDGQPSDTQTTPASGFLSPSPGHLGFFPHSKHPRAFSRPRHPDFLLPGIRGLSLAPASAISDQRRARRGRLRPARSFARLS